MGLIGRQLLHTNPTLQQDAGLRVLKETTEQAGLRGATASGEETGTAVFCLDLRHFGGERGGSGGRTEQGSNGREVVKIGMGGRPWSPLLPA